ncbi:hypothetical protein BGZ70_001592 [Mortierella alpina]|uniref:Uncharacterized protein n=1 Tax=Mortierella alpina TaxID=64518 RepID=A0A9P6IW08_MORAP|nr:hypothetical protein BGZ70_001592 [Mortierella alpina]
MTFSWDDVNVANVFERAVVQYIRSDLLEKAKNVVKKVPTDQPRAPRLDAMFEKVQHEIATKSRLPRGIFVNVMEIMAGDYGAHSSLRSHHFQIRLGPAHENITKFRAIWSREARTIWNEIRRTMVENAGAGASIVALSRPPSDDGAASSSLATTAHAEAGGSHGSVEGREIVLEAKKEQEQLRTCTTTLKTILHPRLEEEACAEFLHLVEDVQENVTDVIFELSAIAYKAFLGLASGQHFGPWVSGAGVADDNTFDLRSVLPPGFVFRDKEVQPIVRAAWLPNGLQADMKHYSTNRPGEEPHEQHAWDLANFLSQGHLQYLYTRFLSPSYNPSTARTAAADNTHPEWRKSAAIIQGQQSDSLDRKANDGLSFTILEHIREYATAVDNLRTGSIFDKLLQYAILLLLRLKLAPERERRYKERLKAAAAKKEERIKTKQGRTGLSSSRWNRRLIKLCDDLSDVLSMPEGEKHTRRWTVVMGCINKLVRCKPAATPKDLPNIERQLEQLMEQDPDNPVQVEVEQGPPVAPEDQDDRGPRDDLDDLGDDDDEDADDEEKDSEDSNEEGMSKMSNSVTTDVDIAWVRRSSFRRQEFTDKECQAVADIVNAFRPYVPKREQDAEGSTTNKPFPHIVLRAPFVLIANSLLRAAGYHDFVRRMMPQIAPSSLHALHLGAVGLYEVLCAESEWHFDVRDINGDPLTTGDDVTKVAGNKQAIFSQFFNLAEIDRLCRAHGLQFNMRIVFVDELTVHLTGKVIAHGQDGRKGYPIQSAYEQRKKDRKGWTTDHKWRQEWLTIQEDYEGYEQALAYVKAQESNAEERKKNEESVLRALRKKHKTTQMAQTLARHGDDYARLKEARLATRAERRVILPREIALKEVKKELYFWNKTRKAAESADSARNRTRSSTNKMQQISTPTWAHPTVEDTTERMDLSTLLQLSANGRPRTVVFAGTDYGVVKMSETVALTRSEIETHLNRYHQLFDVPDDDSALGMDQDQNQNQDRDQSMNHGHGQHLDQHAGSDQVQDQDFDHAMSLDQGQVQDCEQDQGEGEGPGHEQSYEETRGRGQEEGQRQNLDKDQDSDRVHGQGQGEGDGLGREQRIAQLRALKLPPSHKITAGKIDDLSHSRRVAKRRKARLKANTAASEALQDLSKKENALQRALSLQEVDLAQDTRRKHRRVLSEFEHSRCRRKDQHHQRLRTIRTWDKVAAAERRYVMERGRQELTTPPPAPGTSPPIPKPSGHVMPVLFIGDADPGAAGKEQSCDPHAAVNIALAGASPHLDSSRRTLPPYARSFRRTPTNDTGPSPPDPITPSTSASDAARAPVVTAGL